MDSRNESMFLRISYTIPASLEICNRIIFIFYVLQVEFSLSQMKKQSTGDEEIFHFLLASMKAEAKLRTHDLVGKFCMGGIKCTHLLASSADGSPINILVKQQI